MDLNNIQRALEIKQELADLSYFRDNINCRWDNTKMIVKVKNNYSYSIFGSRSFGSGSHTKEIKIPKSLILEVDCQLMKYKESLERELELL